MSLAVSRLNEERKNWRKDHPPNFFARPIKNSDGSTDIMMWECGIPGSEKTDWEGGVYKLQLRFPDDYPINSPEVAFRPTPLWHPNVYPDGEVCLSIIGDDWKPSITVKEILMGVRDLLDSPNIHSPANGEAATIFQTNKKEYSKRIKQQAKRCKE